MAGKQNLFENDTLALIFKNTQPYTEIGADEFVRGSTSAGNLYIALFTDDPTDTGSVANEATYTGYARKAVARSAAGWTVTGNVASNTSAITFASCSGGADTVSHFGICKEGTATVADLIMYGAFSVSLAVSSGVTPQIQAGNLTITED